MFCHLNLFISYVLNIIIIHQIPKIPRIQQFKCKFNLMGRLQHLVALLHPPALKKRNKQSILLNLKIQILLMVTHVFLIISPKVTTLITFRFRRCTFPITTTRGRQLSGVTTTSTMLCRPTPCK